LNALLMDAPEISAAWVSRARRYLFYLVFKLPLSLDDFVEQDAHYAFHYHLADISLDMLRPDGHEALGALVQCLESRAPFAHK